MAFWAIPAALAGLGALGGKVSEEYSADGGFGGALDTGLSMAFGNSPGAGAVSWGLGGAIGKAAGGAYRLAGSVPRIGGYIAPASSGLGGTLAGWGGGILGNRSIHNGSMNASSGADNSWLGGLANLGRSFNDQAQAMQPQPAWYQSDPGLQNLYEAHVPSTFRVTPFNQEAPSSNLSDYLSQTNPFVKASIRSANMPLKQAVKQRRRDQVKNLDGIEDMAREQSINMRADKAQLAKQAKAYEKQIQQTDAELDQIDNALEDRDKNLTGGVRLDNEAHDRKVGAASKHSMDLETNADSYRAGKSAFEDFLDTAGYADMLGTSEDTNAEIVDSQNDVNTLRNQMAVNSAAIGSELRRQIAMDNMSAAQSSYQTALQRWQAQNEMNQKAAYDSLSAQNATLDRRSGLTGYGLQYGLLGGSPLGMFSNLDPKYFLTTTKYDDGDAGTRSSYAINPAWAEMLGIQQ
jgi:hypothetical protein